MTTAPTTTGGRQTLCGDDRSILRSLSVTVPAAAGAALALWAAARLAGVDLTVRTGDGTTTVGWPAVLLASAVATAAGTTTLVLLHRRLRRGRTIGFWLATVVLLLSLVVGPLGATTTAAAFVLGTMHAVVWGVLVGPVRRRR
ncbi:DUF6069 family protein [Kineosporia sp. R_H_3]|uniref:DUF6069 family protein n=1 Tax=Kineosporia sp. R_H_3 TaxID=1961848 RepID=UPI000B4A6405|nr:DUF6069 family protein [Kineosporia sp. R_H_3]